MELDKLQVYYDEERQVSDEGKIFDHWLYKLICIFYASPKFGEHSSKFEWNHDLRGRFQEFEAKSILISIAASSRNNLDIIDERSLKIAQEESPPNVGSLLKYKDGELVCESKLFYREACNKIIHAKKVNFDYAEESPRFGGTLNPIVYLYGDFNNHTWKAMLDIEKFVASAWNHG